MPLGVDMFAAVTGRSGAVVQRQGEGAVGGATEAPASVHATIGRSGEGLPASVRGRFEERMGAGFGDVRIHRDTEAAESARQVSARAYTVGNHVVFGAGMYRPGSADGERLLAHELTHVLQQRGSAGAMQRSATQSGALPVAESGSVLEREADRVADRVVGREPVGPVTAAGPWLQRDEDDADRDGGGTPMVQATVKQFPPKDSPLAKNASAVLVQLHGDEMNSLATAAQMARDYNVIVIYIERMGEGEQGRKQNQDQEKTVNTRSISIKGGSVASVDPNRIFTPKGVRDQVKADESAKGIGGATAQVVAAFGREIYAMIEAARSGGNRGVLPVIGLHNNGPGTLSIDTLETYKIFPAKTSDPKTGATKTLKSKLPKSTNSFSDPDNFVLGTRYDDAEMLAGHFNSVIQSVSNPDDGSLSIRIIRQLDEKGAFKVGADRKVATDPNVQYYNVEAEGKESVDKGRFETNRDMLLKLFELLKVAHRDPKDRDEAERIIRPLAEGGITPKTDYPTLKKMLDTIDDL